MKIFGNEMLLINQKNIENLLKLKENDRIKETNSEKCGSKFQNKLLNYLKNKIYLIIKKILYTIFLNFKKNLINNKNFHFIFSIYLNIIINNSQTQIDF